MKTDKERDELAKIIEEWTRDEDATIGVVAALLALAGLIGFIAFVAWIACHKLP